MVVPITKKATDKIMEAIQEEVKFYDSIGFKLIKRFCYKADIDGNEWDFLVFGNKARTTLQTVSLTFDKYEVIGHGRGALTSEIVDFAKEWYSNDNRTESDIEAKGNTI